MRVYHEFDPVFDGHSRVLVLGSFPSVKSREQHFYYGHPRNRFWPLIAGLAGERCPETVGEKTSLLLRRGIALWDVVESCEITGSADSSIRDIRPNAIGRILVSADIRVIAANGKKAFELYTGYVRPRTGRDALCLPSTSPANAAWSLERLTERWRTIAPYFREEKKSRLTFEAVYRLVRQIPRGRVATYGQIAAALGSIRWARAVGYALHANPDGEKTPCYRVVNREGRVSDAFIFGGRNAQIDLLRADGIPVSDDGYVQELGRYLYDFPPA